ncbi:NAD(P)/FAD-dependent oxidoreductase [Aestuariibacter halophilus]|uniref:NAD(P)/FAD-dependent oxidoreductase n=1 Tax=Fluctibacter halophilus TaxID=226011 RepID=A0ABS8GAY2_9ALTE|nr:NAD(P)/FAD-dependent oxidoreductase [Aestuariibacter halophilus]MCC2617553.1 NAD(P)/FAD-dependent oxidoreductase [Aestuariibacter halophilus]
MFEQDVIVIGAGAAGLFCAAQAGKRGRRVVVLDHAKKVGRKILMSGGGRCNFTNMYASAENFLSDNPHFCKSALSRYTQWDFIGLVSDYGIPYHEKTLGQLFCDDSAKDIVNLLMGECESAGVAIHTQCEILDVDKTTSGFVLQTSRGEYRCESLVVATGGLSMPKLGASPFGYRLAEQFGLRVLPTRAGLVPFTLHEQDKQVLAELSGISLDASAQCNNTSFNESILFTHRGLSGPAVLQISSYWHSGDTVTFDLYPHGTMLEVLQQGQQQHPEAQLSTLLSQHYAKRCVQTLLPYLGIDNKPLKQYQGKQLQQVADKLHAWQIQPNGTEGYRTAEVTLGGVDTEGLSSKTLMAKDVEGLFFIGEVVDVTGWLGGYNFQWAWSSGWVAGQNA